VVLSSIFITFKGKLKIGVFLILITIIFTGCYTKKYQYVRSYQDDRHFTLKHQNARNNKDDKYSFFPYLPNHNRDYVNTRFKKGKEGIYLELVKKYSNKYYISESLVLAIIETESNFNKLAKSKIPAIGLMQIVPRSAGKDVLGWKPTHDYLYNPDNNINVGTKYLNKLYYKYLKNVKDPKSKEYLTIASYNTGAGNVLRSFSKNRKSAFNKINSKSSGEIYNHLLEYLPYKETKDYLIRVTKRKNKYTKYDG
jgi:membrane-bound lytic murein transglycosylase C